MQAGGLREEKCGSEAEEVVSDVILKLNVNPTLLKGLTVGCQIIGEKRRQRNSGELKVTKN